MFVFYCPRPRHVTVSLCVRTDRNGGRVCGDAALKRLLDAAVSSAFSSVNFTFNAKTKNNQVHLKNVK